MLQARDILFDQKMTNLLILRNVTYNISLFYHFINYHPSVLRTKIYSVMIMNDNRFLAHTLLYYICVCVYVSCNIVLCIITRCTKTCFECMCVYVSYNKLNLISYRLQRKSQKEKPREIEGWISYARYLHEDGIHINMMKK